MKKTRHEYDAVNKCGDCGKIVRKHNKSKLCYVCFMKRYRKNMPVKNEHFID
jgi:hypothetical protein